MPNFQNKEALNKEKPEEVEIEKAGKTKHLIKAHTVVWGIFLFIILLGFLLGQLFTERSENTSSSDDTSSFDNVSNINLRDGITIYNGQSADSVFGAIGRGTLTYSGEDPTNPNSLWVTRHFFVGRHAFYIRFCRETDPGPYVVCSIDIPKSDKEVVNGNMAQTPLSLNNESTKTIEPSIDDVKSTASDTKVIERAKGITIVMKNGRTLLWDNYTEGDKKYCTFESAGVEFCINKSDVKSTASETKVISQVEEVTIIMKNGRTLLWDNYTEDDKKYCTFKSAGIELCINKSDVKSFNNNPLIGIVRGTQN